MHPEIGQIWIKQTLVDALVVEADQGHPMETGGVLVGYWSTNGCDAVVTAVIGPGPNAVHRKDGFIPDYVYQEAEIAAHYAASARRHSYLGDWHTHPNSDQTWLSWQDRRTLGRIATAPEARSPKPVMAILAGEPGNWSAAVWEGERRWFGSHFFGARVRPLRLAIC